MSLQVVFRYLVDTLRKVENVRSVTVMDEGALIVDLAQPTFDEEIAIYLLAGELSVDFIKKALNGNTRSDIHTLFILSLDLISEDGKTAHMEEGLRLLLAAYGGKVYAYSIERGEISISPIYIDQAGKVLRDQPVNLANLGGDFIAIDTKYIRGVRKIASFTNHQFSQPAPRRPADPLQPFYELLGVATTATLSEVKRAYRKKARQNHPDTNKSPDATALMQQINEAYAKILARLEN